MGMVTNTVANDAKFFQAIELAVMGQYTDREIAEMSHISTSTLAKWKNTDEWREALASRANIIFRDLIPVALNKLKGLLESNKERVRLDAVKLILDKTLPDLQNVDERSMQAVHVTVEYK
jgi:hypothetical protein